MKIGKPLRIAIIGWGSLIWDPRKLPHEGAWQTGGPVLPLEFSRVSSDCRLTLVIDFVNGEKVTTLFTLSSRTDLRDAIKDLKVREGTTLKRIGYVNVLTGEDSRQELEQASVHDSIAGWARTLNFSAAVWTALPPTFEKKTGKPFSVKNAYDYLASLPCTIRDIALQYIANTPDEVMTPLRREILQRSIVNSKDEP